VGAGRVEIRCPSCGGALASMFSSHGYDFVVCEWCDLAMYRGAERVDDSGALFPSSYFTEGGAGYPDYLADAPVHRRQARYTLRRLVHAGVDSSHGQRLLDVGCAAGFFMAEAAREEWGWAPVGCDVNSELIGYAHGVLGLDVVQASFLDAPFAPGSFDMITMFSVLEHLPRPRDVVERAHDLLRQGGVIAIETWNRRSLAARGMGSRWHVYAPPSCLWYHTPRSLSVLFSSDRWKRLGYASMPKWISVRHAMSALSYTAPKLASVAHRALRYGPVARASIPYVGGDHVFAMFRRDERIA
jgi:SAM-dependent methyltransferase